MAAANGFITVSPDTRWGNAYGSNANTEPEAEKHTAGGSGTIEIGEIGFWGYSSGAGNFCKLGIFTHDAVNNCPETIIANSETDPIALPTSVGKVYFTYSTKPQLTGGTVYWLAIITSAGDTSESRFAGGGNSMYKGSAVLYTWPTATEWETHTDQGNQDSMYAVYEVAAGGTTISCLISDGLHMGDATVNVAQLYAGAADGLTLADSGVRRAILRSSVADGFAAGDSDTKRKVCLGIGTDGVTLGDSGSRRGIYRPVASDGATFGDSSSALASLLAVIADGASFADASDWQAAIQAAVADGIALGDSASGIIAILALAADGVTFTDANTARITLRAALADGVTFTDTIAALAKLLATAADGIKLTDISAELSQLASGIVTLTFTAKQPGIAFTAKAPSITFGVKQPDITFTGRGS